MQIVENWSDVEGEIKEFAPNPSDPSSSLAKVVVCSAEPVASFPNLLANHVGKEITVRIPSPPAQENAFEPGAHVRLRIRQGGPDRFFSHPEHVEKIA
jgi:hypothetical protein